MKEENDPFRPAIDHFMRLVSEGTPRGLAIFKAAEFFGLAWGDLADEMSRRAKIRRQCKNATRKIQAARAEIDHSRADIYG